MLTDCLKRGFNIISSGNQCFWLMYLLSQLKFGVVQVADDMTPLRVLALFSAITAEDCILLDIADRPEFLIMTHVPVPPVCIRPSVEMDSGQGSNEDDLTVRLRVSLICQPGFFCHTRSAVQGNLRGCTGLLKLRMA